MYITWLDLVKTIVLCCSCFITLSSGLECICNTDECKLDRTPTCHASSFCYSQVMNEPGVSHRTLRGCIDSKTPILCENRRPSKLTAAWPVLHCCKKDFCNRDIVPTPPSPKPPEVVPDSFNRKYPKEDATEAPSKCPNSVYGTNGGSSKMINPIYIAVPVAGVCVLLALIIFAMYLLRRRTDYYERYQYPKTISVPQHHQTCNETKCANACKLNRCTDSERSSSGSETKLFL